MSAIPGTLAPYALCAALAIGALAIPSAAQVEWTLVDEDGNLARYGTGTAFDPTGGDTILFGGFRTPAKNLSDTWLWNGTSWTASPTAAAPLGRHSFGMCTDGTAGVLLFGGARDPNAVLPDTWRYANGDWQLLTPATVPPRRMEPGMALLGDRVVMFGGQNRETSTQFGDTWTWDGTDWSQQLPAQSPPPRTAPAMAADPVRGRVLLYGGRDVTRGPILGDTWEWDGTTWTQRNPVTSPPPLASAGLAYDPVRERMVLFGGVNQTESSETWEWDSETWIQRFPSEDIPARDRIGMFYDAPRGNVVMVGGSVNLPEGDAESLEDTWVYATTAPASITSVGAGCPGSDGTPNLAPVFGGRPWLGESFQLQLTSLPLGSPPLLVLGLSDTTWGALPLPFALDSFGLPGCTAYTSADAAVPLTNVAGTAVCTIAVPNSPVFLGRTLYAQAAVPDATANAFGASVSNAAEILFGAK